VAVGLALGVTAVGEGLALWPGAGEPDDDVGDGLGELAEGLGDGEVWPGEVGCAVGAVDFDGWPPTRLPTVVPPPVWCQTTASSGLPAATSNTVMPPSTTTNTAALAATTRAQTGQRRSRPIHRASHHVAGPPGSPRPGSPPPRSFPAPRSSPPPRSPAA
jgi:hypothetical protein